MNMYMITILVLILTISSSTLAQNEERYACEKDENAWVQSMVKGVDDFAQNPILTANGQLFEWILGDPTVIRDEESGEIHLFANTIFHGLNHYVNSCSSNLTDFKRLDKSPVWYPGSVRPYVMRHEEYTYLFYEQYSLLSLYKASTIQVVRALSTDLTSWSKPVTILKPELDWELIGTKRVGNPYVYFDQKIGKFRMYYSASSLHLPDSNIDEPLHLGLAESDSIMQGEWTRVTNIPLKVNVNPDPDQFDMVGVGSFKLVDGHEDDSIALMNQITRRRSDNSTGSTVSLVKINGLEIEPIATPLIPPTLKPGSWKESYVYGFDTLRVGDDFTMVYYNARNGWKGAVETIGVSRVHNSAFGLQLTKYG